MLTKETLMAAKIAWVCTKNYPQYFICKLLDSIKILTVRLCKEMNKLSKHRHKQTFEKLWTNHHEGSKRTASPQFCGFPLVVSWLTWTSCLPQTKSSNMFNYELKQICLSLTRCNFSVIPFYLLGMKMIF